MVKCERRVLVNFFVLVAVWQLIVVLAEDCYPSPNFGGTCGSGQYMQGCNEPVFSFQDMTAPCSVLIENTIVSSRVSVFGTLGVGTSITFRNSSIASVYFDGVTVDGANITFDNCTIGVIFIRQTEMQNAALLVFDNVTVQTDEKPVFELEEDDFTDSVIILRNSTFIVRNFAFFATFKGHNSLRSYFHIVSSNVTVLGPADADVVGLLDYSEGENPIHQTTFSFSSSAFDFGQCKESHVLSKIIFGNGNSFFSKENCYHMCGGNAYVANIDNGTATSVSRATFSFEGDVVSLAPVPTGGGVTIPGGITLPGGITVPSRLLPTLPSASQEGDFALIFFTQKVKQSSFSFSRINLNYNGAKKKMAFAILGEMSSNSFIIVENSVNVALSDSSSVGHVIQCFSVSQSTILSANNILKLRSKGGSSLFHVSHSNKGYAHTNCSSSQDDLKFISEAGSASVLSSLRGHAENFTMRFVSSSVEVSGSSDAYLFDSAETTNVALFFDSSSVQIVSQSASCAVTFVSIGTNASFYAETSQFTFNNGIRDVFVMRGSFENILFQSRESHYTVLSAKAVAVLFLNFDSQNATLISFKDTFSFTSTPAPQIGNPESVDLVTALAVHNAKFNVSNSSITVHSQLSCSVFRMSNGPFEEVEVTVFGASINCNSAQGSFIAVNLDHPGSNVALAFAANEVIATAGRSAILVGSEYFQQNLLVNCAGNYVEFSATDDATVFRIHGFEKKESRFSVFYETYKFTSTNGAAFARFSAFSEKKIELLADWCNFSSTVTGADQQGYFVDVGIGQLNATFAHSNFALVAPRVFGIMVQKDSTGTLVTFLESNVTARSNQRSSIFYQVESSESVLKLTDSKISVSSGGESATLILLPYIVSQFQFTASNSILVVGADMTTAVLLTLNNRTELIDSALTLSNNFIDVSSGGIAQLLFADVETNFTSTELSFEENQIHIFSIHGATVGIYFGANTSIPTSTFLLVGNQVEMRSDESTVDFLVVSDTPNFSHFVFTFFGNTFQLVGRAEVHFIFLGVTVDALQFRLQQDNVSCTSLSSSATFFDCRRGLIAAAFVLEKSTSISVIAPFGVSTFFLKEKQGGIGEEEEDCFNVTVSIQANSSIGIFGFQAVGIDIAAFCADLKIDLSVAIVVMNSTHNSNFVQLRNSTGGDRDRFQNFNMKALGSEFQVAAENGAALLNVTSPIADATALISNSKVVMRSVADSVSLYSFFAESIRGVNMTTHRNMLSLAGNSTASVLFLSGATNVWESEFNTVADESNVFAALASVIVSKKSTFERCKLTILQLNGTHRAPIVGNARKGSGLIYFSESQLLDDSAAQIGNSTVWLEGSVAAADFDASSAIRNSNVTISSSELTFFPASGFIVYVDQTAVLEKPVFYLDYNNCSTNDTAGNISIGLAHLPRLVFGFDTINASVECNKILGRLNVDFGWFLPEIVTCFLTPSLSMSNSQTKSFSIQLTNTSSATPSGSVSVSMSVHPSVTNSSSFSITPAETPSTSQVGTSSETFSATQLASATDSHVATKSRTVSPPPTPTFSIAATISHTVQPTQSLTITRTRPPTPTPTASLTFTGTNTSAITSSMSFVLTASHTISTTFASTKSTTTTATQMLTLTGESRTLSTSQLLTITDSLHETQSVSSSHSLPLTSTAEVTTSFTESLSITTTISVSESRSNVTTETVSLGETLSDTVSTTATKAVSLTETVTGTESASCIQPTLIVAHPRRLDVYETYLIGTVNLTWTISEPFSRREVLSRVALVNWGTLENITLSADRRTIRFDVVLPREIVLTENYNIQVTLLHGALKCNTDYSPFDGGVSIESVWLPTPNLVREITAGVALLSSAASLPSVATAQARAGMMLELSLCKFSHSAPLPYSVSPLQISFGDPVGAYYRGAVVGNLLILGLFCVGACVIIHAKSRRSKLRPRPTFGATAATLYLPGLFVVPFAVLLQPITSASLSCGLHGNATGDIVFSSAGVIVAVVGMLWCSSKLIWGFRSSGEEKRIHWPQKVGFWEMMALISCKTCLYKDKFGAHSPETKKESWTHAHSMLFRGFHAKAHWFVCLELLTAFCCGILEGVRPSSAESCKGLASTALVIMIVHVPFAFWFVPHCTLMMRAVYMAVTALSIAVCVCLLISSRYSQTASDIFTIVIVVIGLLTIARREMLRLHRKWVKLQGRALVNQDLLAALLDDGVEDQDGQFAGVLEVPEAQPAAAVSIEMIPLADFVVEDRTSQPRKRSDSDARKAEGVKRPRRRSNKKDQEGIEDEVRKLELMVGVLDHISNERPVEEVENAEQRELVERYRGNTSVWAAATKALNSSQLER